jgi:DNA-directed RNA polymerase subunit K/omega
MVDLGYGTQTCFDLVRVARSRARRQAKANRVPGVAPRTKSLKSRALRDIEHAFAARPL